MKKLFTLSLIFISSLSIAQKGKSIFKEFDFIAQEQNAYPYQKSLIKQTTAKGDIFSFVYEFEKQTIGHINAAPFIAFSANWFDDDAASNSTKIKISFSKDGNNFSQFETLKEDGHYEGKTGTHVSQLKYLDKQIKYYKLSIATAASSKQIQTLKLNFFNPSGEATAIQQSPIAQRQTEEIESCPCPLQSYTTRTQWNCPQGQGLVSGVGASTSVTHLIVHHAAGPNTSSNWAATVLSVWNFHTGTNGWSDVGYNWLIAPDGTLFEGRGSNSLTQNVTGAHFCGTNANTMGVCMLGTYTSTQITTAARATLVKLLAWKSCQQNISPTASALHSSSGLTLNRISGHRDGCSTTCPGNMLYGILPTIRTEVQASIDTCGNAVPPTCLPSVKLSAAGCPSTTQTFTPINIVNGGTAPTYAWFLNNVQVATGASYTLSNAVNGDKVHALMTSNATCASPTQVRSDTLTVTCIPAPTCLPSVKLSAAGCPSTTQTFTPINIVNGGTAPTYAWFLNNVQVATGASYTLNNAVNGDKVHALMTSNATCASPTQVRSDTLTVTCIPAPSCLPSVKLSFAGCPSNTQTFTPINIVNGGTAPTYAWFLNNIQVATGPSYTLNNAVTGDKVHALMTSNATCASPTQVRSDTITVTCLPAPSCLPSLKLSVTGCPSTTQTYTPINIVNGGTAPTYAWFLNNTYK
jgi:thiamine pyrophosphokinase